MLCFFIWVFRCLCGRLGPLSTADDPGVAMLLGISLEVARSPLGDDFSTTGGRVSVYSLARLVFPSSPTCQLARHANLPAKPVFFVGSGALRLLRLAGEVVGGRVVRRVVLSGPPGCVAPQSMLAYASAG